MELENLVLVVCAVHVDFPGDVLGNNRTVVNLELEAHVAHRTYVHRY